MELNAEHRITAMRETHDLANVRSRCHVEVGIVIQLDDQRVIAPCAEPVGNAGENAFARMADFRGLAMERPFGSHHPPSESLADALVPETDAEDRQAARELAHNRQ